MGDLQAASLIMYLLTRNLKAQSEVSQPGSPDLQWMPAAEHGVALGACGAQGGDLLSEEMQDLTANWKFSPNLRPVCCLIVIVTTYFICCWP